MSSDAPKPVDGGAAPQSSGTPAPVTPAPGGPTSSPPTEPREIMIYVTNKQWECRLQEGSPHLENGFQKAIKGDENPHHWGQKRFQVFDGPGAGLIEIKAGDPQIQFWAHSKNEDRKLTLYWVCRKKHPQENRIIWFVFAPNYADERQVARGSDFWGWEVILRFYAKSKVDSWVCEHCTFLNTRVDDECEMCKTAAPPERKSTPIKRGPVVQPRPPVMQRASSMDSDSGQQGGQGSNHGSSTKHGWWTCISCSGENPPSMYLCEFCGKEEYGPLPSQYMKNKPDDPASKKPVVVQKGVSESFGVPVPSSTT